VRFRRPELLREAMTHASWTNERGGPSGPGYDNERLEYLGDAVLELVVGEYLFRRFPGYDEGQLTQLRAALVNTVSLARLAERLGLGDSLLVGRGAAKTGARALPSLLANSFEAMIGALFLDQGYRVATRVFLQNIGDLADWTDANFKGRLQEAAQERSGSTPVYRVVSRGGAGHRREYLAEAIVDGEVLAEGTGTTKQAAEQAAAKLALARLVKPPSRRRARRPAAAAEAEPAPSRAVAAEPLRVRRRIAEAAADTSASASARAQPPPRRAVSEPESAAAAASRRRGLLSVLRSAAEALVGRPLVAGDGVPPAAEFPPPAEAPVAPARKSSSRRGRRGGRGRRRAAATADTAPSGETSPPRPTSRRRRKPATPAAEPAPARPPRGEASPGTPRRRRRRPAAVE